MQQDILPIHTIFGNMLFLSTSSFLLLVGARAASLSTSAAAERNSYVYRHGSELRLAGQRWTMSGANVYWLGLDENVIPPEGQPFYAPFNASYPTFGRITEIMNIVNTMGGRAIRAHTLGVSVGNPLSLMPALDVFNDEAFKTMDWTVYQAREHGIRLFAPLVDNYDYYHGGKFDFLRFRGINTPSTSTTNVLNPIVQQFYTNKTIVDDFKNYIKHLITHRNPYTGLTFAEDPTIFAYETGNELGGPIFGDMDVPVAWTSEISAYIKSLAPQKLVIDGTYGVNKTHLSIPTIDIFSDHFYPRNLTKLDSDIALVGGANRVYVAGEYEWGPQTLGDSLPSFYSAIEARQRLKEPVIAGDLFWSLFGHDVPDCTRFVNHSSDANTMQYGNPENPANVTAQIGIIRKHLFAMKGETVKADTPAVACPGPLSDPTYH